MVKISSKMPQLPVVKQKFLKFRFSTSIMGESTMLLRPQTGKANPIKQKWGGRGFQLRSEVYN